jgi:hypothetical protein
MKELYKSPVVTVEELTKVDVLCESGGAPGPNPPAPTTTVKENTVASFTNLL